MKPEVRRILAWRVARNSFFVLVCSLLLGALILEFYGISIPVLRVAGSTDEIMFVLASLLAVVVIAVCIFLCFAYADRVQRLLGPGGTDIAVRLSAFILFCLGVQILWSGSSELLKSVIHSGS